MLKLKKTAEPATPATGGCEIFLDISDNTLKVKKDNGIVEILEQFDMNALKLDSQVFQGGVVMNDPVYYNTGTLSRAKADSSTQTPTGVRGPLNSVILTGVFVTSGLVTNTKYYLNPAGGLTTTPNNTVIGFAFTATSFYVDIDVEGIGQTSI